MATHSPSPRLAFTSQARQCLRSDHKGRRSRGASSLGSERPCGRRRKDAEKSEEKREWTRTRTTHGNRVPHSAVRVTPEGRKKRRNTSQLRRGIPRRHNLGHFERSPPLSLSPVASVNGRIASCQMPIPLSPAGDRHSLSQFSSKGEISDVFNGEEEKG